MGGVGSIPATAAAWSVLSRACHHHPYELAATANELRALLGVAHRFAAEVARQSCPSPGGGTTVLRSHFYHPRRLRTLNDVVGCVSAEIAGNTAPVEVFV